MKLSLEENKKLKELGENASDLLVKIMDEELLLCEAIKLDKDFKNTLLEIHEICPLLSESYENMYNYIQKQKITKKENYRRN